jgi:hypothetical protein
VRVLPPLRVGEWRHCPTSYGFRSVWFQRLPAAIIGRNVIGFSDNLYEFMQSLAKLSVNVLRQQNMSRLRTFQGKSCATTDYIFIWYILSPCILDGVLSIVSKHFFYLTPMTRLKQIILTPNNKLYSSDMDNDA